VIYFDAAYIAKCYLNEPGADRVRQVAYGADGLASCELARLEFASILKAVVVRRCTVCHGTDVIVDTPRTVPVWTDTVLLMKDFGAEGSEEDWKTVADYLMTHLAMLTETGSVPPPAARSARARERFGRMTRR
jgi:hypothetical protein